jgi:hypothetical protein
VAALAGELGDALEVGVVVEDGQAGLLGAGGDEQVWQRNRAVLGALGEHRLNLQRPRNGGVVDRCARQAAQSLDEGTVRGAIASAVEKLQVDDAAGGDLAGDEQRLEHVANLGPCLTPGQGALVREKGGHVGGSAPGFSHRLGIVESERAGSEQQLDELLSLARLHDLGERGVHRVRQRLRTEDLLGGVDFFGVDLKGGLMTRGSGHRVPNIAKFWEIDS